jgi:hypothetical protein
MLPDIDNLIMGLEDAKVMSVIDLEAGFWQVEVDDESAKLLTFATPWGRYEYRRLPFGISIAPEIFHKAVVDALAGIPGVEVYVDDIFVHGKNDEEHDERFDQVMSRLQEKKFTPNRAKIQKKKRKIKFLGHVIGEGKIEPDPEKIAALTSAPEPTSRKDLKSFTGALAWNRKYIPNVHELLAPFRTLMKERTPWIWETKHADAFRRIKEELTKILPLMTLKRGEPMILATDASSYGLGACLTQKDEHEEERPIFFASRLMTDAEIKWAQVDKELLAVAWGLERLDNYVYGRKIRIRTDHKPLLGLVKKPLAHLSTRQQRLMARLMRYDFELEFCPGKELIVPDFLSRAVSNDEQRCRCHFMGTDIEIEQAFVSMVQAVQISEEIEKRVRECSGKEEEYQATIRAYGAAWPRKLQNECGEYWSHRDEITEEEGLLFFQGRSLHRGHVGQKAAMKRATKAVWWPGWTAMIKEFGRLCGQCQDMKPAQQKETMKSFPVPPAPGLVWHSDYLTWHGQEYVFFVDGFSGWSEVYTAPSRTPAALIRITRLQMMRQGVPRKIQADQGSTYNSKEFKEFCEKWGIQLVLSSPKHEQGNAIAEAFVKKLKRLFEGSKDEDELVAAYLAMNQTPIGPGRPSPAEIHLGRNVRDEMHGKISQAQVEWEEVKTWKEEKQMTDKTLYDRGARDLPDLKTGDAVRVWHNECWKKGHVQGKNKERPRSYKVELNEGRCVERNRVKIRKADEKERPANEKTVSPTLTFSQALPSQEVAPQPRWGVMISTENDPGLPPDNERNLEESTAREDSGPSTLPANRPTAPPSRPQGKKKPKNPRSNPAADNTENADINAPIYVPVSNTRSGRTVKEVDRLIVSM